MNVCTAYYLHNLRYLSTHNNYFHEFTSDLDTGLNLILATNRALGCTHSAHTSTAEQRSTRRQVICKSKRRAACCLEHTPCQAHLASSTASSTAETLVPSRHLYGDLETSSHTHQSQQGHHIAGTLAAGH